LSCKPRQSFPVSRPSVRTDRWIIHWSLRRMACATSDLRLPSQAQSVTAHKSEPNYTASWEKHKGTNNVSRVVTQQRPDREWNRRATSWSQVRRCDMTPPPTTTCWDCWPTTNFNSLHSFSARLRRSFRMYQVQPGWWRCSGARVDLQCTGQSCSCQCPPVERRRSNLQLECSSMMMSCHWSDTAAPPPSNTTIVTNLHCTTCIKRTLQK